VNEDGGDRIVKFASDSAPRPVRSLIASIILPLFLYSCANQTDPFPTFDVPARFTTPVNFSVTPATSSRTPRIAVEGSGAIDVVWEEDGEILFSQSTDGGSSFTIGQLISDPLTVSTAPAIVVDDAGNINVAWEEDNVVVFSRSTDAGANFSVPQNISNPAKISNTLGISVDGAGNINVVWEEDYDIYFSRSSNGGGTFSSPLNLSNTLVSGPTGFSATPDIAVNGTGDIHVVWEDGRAGSPDIYHSRRTYYGAWSEPARANDPQAGDQTTGTPLNWTFSKPASPIF